MGFISISAEAESMTEFVFVCMPETFRCLSKRFPFPLCRHESRSQVVCRACVRLQGEREGFVQLLGGNQAEAQQRVDELGASVADERV